MKVNRFADEMEEFVAQLAATTRKSKEDIWDDAKSAFDKKANGAAYSSMTAAQVFNKVNNTRSRLHGGDAIRAVEDPQFSLLDPDVEGMWPLFGCSRKGDWFLQFNLLKPLKWKTTEKPKMTRIMGFANPKLLSLLRDKHLSCFIDCTFSCTPDPFTQTMILMVHDNRTDTYVPVYYVLLPGKAETIYSLAFQLILQSVESFMPIEVHCDFEHGLMKAIRGCFPAAKIVGCLFHFKQAIQRKMKKLHIKPDQIHALMTPGQFDILCLVPKEELLTGIEFVKSLVDVTNTTASSQFWNYFKSTWMKR